MLNAETTDDIADTYEYLSSELRNITKLHGFKIVHQNIRSLSKKIDQLRLIMNELKAGIHLLALTGTWAGGHMLDSEFEIPGYKLFR